MGKVKVCLVIPSLQAGGMERVMSTLIDHFVLKKEAEIHLVLYGITREIFYSLPDDIIVHKPSFVFNNSWRLFNTLRTLIFLRGSIKEIAPTTILSFGEYWNNFLLLSLIGQKYPVFISDRSQPNKSLGRFHNKLRNRLYPRAKGLILQTEKAKEIYLQKNKHNRIKVIGNPIKTTLNNTALLQREKIVLMVGRLIESKHQDQLIEMFAKVGHPDWKLMIVGFDHLRQQNMERLKNLAKVNDVAQRVIFTGRQDNIEEYYLKSSIFAFTSSSEGFPNVIGEAMSAGLPVVAYDCVAGPSEMIQDGQDGFLIPLFDTLAFEAKLSLLMENDILRESMGLNAMKSIERFNSEDICGSFYQFILE